MRVHLMVAAAARRLACVSEPGSGTVLFMAVVYPFTVPVNGISSYQQAAEATRRGAKVLVVPEPENPYDSNAYRIDVPGAGCVGYVPAAVAAKLAAAHTPPLEGVVTERYDCHETIGLRVLVQDPADRGAAEPGVATGPTPDVEPQVEARPPVVVMRRSKRPLGLYVGTEDSKTVVRTDSGSTVSYPSDLVEVAART